jgi:hypothetical protein
MIYEKGNIKIFDEEGKAHFIENVPILIDSGTSWNFCAESLLKKIPNPLYKKTEEGTIRKCGGEGMGRKKVVGKASEIEVEIPGKCEAKMGIFTLHPVCVIPDKEFPQELKVKDIKLILGNLFIELTIAVIEGNKLVKCIGTLI